ncbi:hypothetical protein RhiirA5_434666 [Rhizophagus irregularis]|uniref:Gag-pol fusion protein: PROVISIONAL n=3 Tax=Rhizophagus irregularis TaxID=588596 RepID=A0A2N0NPN4_9GLOM|nr:hypothetical protein RirG_057820 [Rhizophagus irregularis DAOM 197198w]PKB96531.1 hypothetical protein RhiirA5_434666 [Rhizophagus irregularis]GBC24806.1 hypothetical protein GLOIN_2v1781428 [Rhizophagus irregularis DAOM 181602=DAOM 197198]
MAEINAYQRILEDLRQLQPTEIVAYPPPYTITAGLEEKFDLINAAIERSKRIDDRILMLANVYYLGHFLEVEIRDNTRRGQFLQQLSIHFRTIAIRTYYIFEVSGVEQIMRTTHTTPTMIRKLSTAEYKDLVFKSIEIFNGVENPGGSGVNRIIT